jgi:ATP-dependent 26S proteasome regulatory subunit
MNREQDSSSAASGVQSRILTTLLNEMDGITNTGSSQSVLVVAATNRLESVDSALLRPGRLEEHILLSYPDSSSVLEILKIRTAKMPLNDSVNLLKWSDVLSKASFSCAEVEGVCRDACLIAMRRCSDETDLRMLSITDSDFEEAFGLVRKNL